MKINFEEIKKQPLNNQVLLSVLEVLYTSIKQERPQNIKINEFCSAKIINGIQFEIELTESPLSINDILIVSSSGNTIVTPTYIEEIKDKKVIFTSNSINANETLFVTYKY